MKIIAQFFLGENFDCFPLYYRNINPKLNFSHVANILKHTNKQQHFVIIYREYVLFQPLLMINGQTSSKTSRQGSKRNISREILHLHRYNLKRNIEDMDEGGPII